jgi:hypothetical protein
VETWIERGALRSRGSDRAPALELVTEPRAQRRERTELTRTDNEIAARESVARLRGTVVFVDQEPLRSKGIDYGTSQLSERKGDVKQRRWAVAAYYQA